MGCCWLLFLVLFSVRLMSFPWMAMLTVLIFIEKLPPQGSKASDAIGALFVALGTFFIFFPELGASAHVLA